MSRESKSEPRDQLECQAGEINKKQTNKPKTHKNNLVKWFNQSDGIEVQQARGTKL